MVKEDRIPRSQWWRRCIVLLIFALHVPHATAQTRPSPSGAVVPRTELRGMTVEDVRVLGNKQVSTAVILNAVRTRPGDKFDPETVREDYQRIYGLRKFSNVEAKVEPTSGGVIVVFVVTEQRQISSIVFRGNLAIDTQRLQSVVGLRAGEAIDRFRISLAKQSIENLYRDKNYPFAHVDVPPEPLAERGELIFQVVEGPNVRVRNIDFKGARSFNEDKLKKQIQTRTWIFIFRSGTYNPQTVDDDAAALQRFYQQKGFFDARVGRKLVWSPDLKELQIDFLIDEGTRYIIDRITFKGISSVSEAVLRADLKLREGMPFDNDILQRDIRQLVRVFSPLGFIYQPFSQDPDYLRIDAKPVFGTEPGRIELVYDMSEGKPFRLGRIIVKGNAKTQDKVILREMRVAPGQLYNSAEIQDATERLRGTPFFTGVAITPIGEDPEVRDVLVEVQEGRTASFNIGAGVNSNGGLGGNLTYEQKNFDITDWPQSWSEMFNGQGFVGAGQVFRASLEPGTEINNISLFFSEPYLFDQSYGFSSEAYFRTRIFEDYNQERLGGRLALTKRFNYVWSGRLNLRAELVDINDIDDKEIRADEILDVAGTSPITSVGFQIRRDTTNRGLLPSKGTTTTVTAEFFGALGGDYYFQRYTLDWDGYMTLREDLLDRKTILSLRGNVGYIAGDAPFFETFYAGGLGSVRGFAFRGISPRSGPADDAVGGDFLLTGSAEVSFPLVGESLRGVVFSDAGTVEPQVEFGTIRTSVGAGFRLTLPLLGQTPIAVDFAYPLTKDDEDDTQVISFSFGFTR